MFYFIRSQISSPNVAKANALVAQHHSPNTGDTIFTNPLDEQQQLITKQEESTLSRTQAVRVLISRFVYVF